MDIGRADEKPAGAHRLWVLSDGRAGHDAQALGLAEALARRLPARIERLALPLHRWAAALPSGVLLRLLRNGVPTPTEGAASLAPPWPDLAIAAGRRTAPILAFLRAQYGVPAVQILNPGLSAMHFDHLIAPSHDRMRAPNAIETVGAIGRLAPAGLAAEADRWRARLTRWPPPRLAVLLGGPSRSARWSVADETQLCQALGQIETQSWSLLITPSRRTPPGLLRRLQVKLPESAFLWDGTGDNPYPAILGLADAVLVTQDSVNMACEAASTGLPVHIFPVARVATKIRAFHRTLQDHGAARPFRGVLDSWDYTPLAEADRVAAFLDPLFERGTHP
ncbi:MAG: mitochondrial fission ELM1 family protein [Pseudomonadota bacterium]